MTQSATATQEKPAAPQPPADVLSIAWRICSLPPGQHLITVTKQPGQRIELVVLSSGKIEYQKPSIPEQGE